jgi:hypothetical protein
MERCLRNYSWVESSHLSGERELHLVSLNRAPHGAMGWRRTAVTLAAPPMVVWMVDTAVDYEHVQTLVGDLGSFSTLFVSNRPQALLRLHN